MKRDQMSAAEYRKLIGAKSNKGTTSMTAEEWRNKMKKHANKKPTKQVDEIRIMLQLAKLPFVEEHKFHPKRKWRFDFAIPSRMIAIEYEGIFSEKSGHTTHKGYIKDTEKYNEAAKLGWTVLRYTAKTYKEVIDDIDQLPLPSKLTEPVENWDNEEDNWDPCDNCDLPDACADFGCAIKQGLKEDPSI